jgi:hypothetical protein
MSRKHNLILFLITSQGWIKSDSYFIFTEQAFSNTKIRMVVFASSYIQLSFENP